MDAEDRELDALAKRIGYGNIIKRIGPLWAMHLIDGGLPAREAVTSAAFSMDCAARDLDTRGVPAEAGGDEG